MDQAWLDELSELLRIPSVSADPQHAGDVRRAGEWVRDFVRRAGGEAELQETRLAAARHRRHPRVVGRRRRADDPRLRPLRRAAAGAARALGQRSVRADDSRRVALRARRRRRQGPALDAAERRSAARRGRCAARSPAHRVRRRGGDRRAVDRRVPRERRARRRRVHHLRLGDGAPRRAGDLHGDARRDVVRAAGSKRRARPSLRRVRQRGAQRDARADAGARRDHAARRTPARAAARRHRAAVGRGARELERAHVRRRCAPRRGRGAVRRRRCGRVPPAHDGRAVGRRERHPRRQAGAPEHDDPGRRAGELLGAARARAGRRRRSPRPSSG